MSERHPAAPARAESAEPPPWVLASDLRHAVLRGLVLGVPGWLAGVPQRDLLRGLGGWLCLGAGIGAGALLERAVARYPARGRRDGLAACGCGLLPGLAVVAAAANPGGGFVGGVPGAELLREALLSIAPAALAATLLAIAIRSRLIDRGDPNLASWQKPGFGPRGQRALVRACFGVALALSLLIGVSVLADGQPRQALQGALLVLLLGFLFLYLSSLLTASVLVAVEGVERLLFGAPAAWPPSEARDPRE